MKYQKSSMFLGALIAGTFLPLVASAGQVSMELTGVEGPSMGGVYTSPYQALVGPAGLTHSSQFTPSNSVKVDIYCDDFLREVGVGIIWQANVTSVGALASNSSPLPLKFQTGDLLTQRQDYIAEAYLAEELSKVDQSTPAGKQEAGELSFAMWGIFDPGPGGALSRLSGTELADATTDMTDAFTFTAGKSASEFANVFIYTPDPTDASQEYLVVTNVPEPGTLALMVMGFVGLAAVVRRRVRTARAD